MPQPSMAVRGAAQTLSLYLGRGLSRAQAQAEFERHYGQLGPGEMYRALHWAERLLAVKAAAKVAAPGTRLRDLLGGIRPPEAVVDVPVHILADTGLVDKEGDPIYRHATVYIRASWNDTIADVQAQALDRVEHAREKYDPPQSLEAVVDRGFLFYGGYGSVDL